MSEYPSSASLSRADSTGYCLCADNQPSYIVGSSTVEDGLGGQSTVSPDALISADAMTEEDIKFQVSVY